MAHVDPLITDYVLDLLSAEERRAVEQHAAECPNCMRLLLSARKREARLTREFRATMAPPPGRIEALWPQLALALDGAAGPRSGWLPSSWRDQWRLALAVLALVLIGLAGTFGGRHAFDGWLLSTYTPTLAATPTISLTPAFSDTPADWTVTASENFGTIVATRAPAPAVGSPAPAPPPVPATLTLTDG
jgi:anti-sigma factor RsiW